MGKTRERDKRENADEDERGEEGEEEKRNKSGKVFLASDQAERRRRGFGLVLSRFSNLFKDQHGLKRRLGSNGKFLLSNRKEN